MPERVPAVPLSSIATLKHTELDCAVAVTCVSIGLARVPPHPSNDVVGVCAWGCMKYRVDITVRDVRRARSRVT